jgi:acyl carrier protein
MPHKLNDLIADLLNVPSTDLTPDTGPENLPAWDSLAHVSIVAGVEETYKVQLTMPEILAIRSIADLRKTLEGHGVAAEALGSAG